MIEFYKIITYQSSASCFLLLWFWSVHVFENLFRSTFFTYRHYEISPISPTQNLFFLPKPAKNTPFSVIEIQQATMQTEVLCLYWGIHISRLKKIFTTNQPTQIFLASNARVNILANSDPLKFHNFTHSEFIVTFWWVTGVGKIWHIVP